MEDTNKNVKKRFSWQFQPGNPGGPGRPKGSKSLKEFAREYLQSLPDDKKIEYLESLPEEIVWKMAEGNPAQETKVDAKIEVDYDPELKQKVETNIKGLLNIPNEQLTN